MRQPSIIRHRTPYDTLRAARWIWAALCGAAPALLSSCVTTCDGRRPATPIVLSSAAAPPIPLSFSPEGEASVTAVLPAAGRPGMTRVDLQDLSRRSITSVSVDTAAAEAARRSFTLPSPWNGQLRVTPPSPDGGPVESVFVGVVLEPLLPESRDNPPRVIYGPEGRSTVLLSGTVRPGEGTRILITHPATSTPPPPPGVVGDAVEIAFLPAAPDGTTGIVGLTPLVAPANARLVVNLFDAKTRTWSALPSHVVRDGTVFARGPLPGVYALAVAP